MFDISNAEFTLLALINEIKECSGYRLNNEVEGRGYKQWADIGMTSIYNGLKKIETKGLAVSQLVTNKKTRGPAARIFRITPEGKKLLKTETLKGLSQTREKDKRFDLALSSADILPDKQVLAALEKRIEFLREETLRLEEIRRAQEEVISYLGRILFEHSIHSMKSEIIFLQELMRTWKKEI